VQQAVIAAGAVAHVVATHKGNIAGGRRSDLLTVDKSFHTACPAEADAVIIANGTSLENDRAVITYVQSAFRHYKPIAAWGDGEQLLANAGIAASDPGVLVVTKANKSFAKSCLDALAVHRHWERAATHPTRALEQGV
jgi:catalase